MQRGRPSRARTVLRALLPVLIVALVAPAWGQVSRVRFVSPRHLSTVLGPTEIELTIEVPKGLSVAEVLLRVDGKPLVALTEPGTLVMFRADLPSATTAQPVTGVNGRLLGIDYRPSTDTIYGVTDTSEVYTVDAATGVALDRSLHGS